MPESPGGEPSQALAVFGLQQGPREGEELAVRSPVATIGQGPQNDVVLEDDSVSRSHARLEYGGGGWRLTDLGSVNGTAIDGVRLEPQVPTPLSPGATVRFGGVSARFQPVEAADPEAARARFAPPAPEIRVAERQGFRFPLWMLVLLLILVALAVYFLLLPAPAATATALAAAVLPLAPPGVP
jgi:pSer/pThr/pTyr-binding forkhead associated (FHA) protein